MENMLLKECKAAHNIVICFVVLRMLKHSAEDCLVGI
jgi:hypothetical protein